jgi:site-specific DNA-methyltransferase (adenine-specific)
MIKKMDEALVKQVIAKKLESQETKGTLHQLSKCFIVKDFFRGVREIPDNIMHLVEIDPPYAIDLTAKKKKEGESQYMLSDYNEVDSEGYVNFMYTTFKECYRVMADHSWLICWFAPEPWFCPIYKLLTEVGFGTTRMCGIWTKSSPAQNMQPATRLSNSYEEFFYAWKGQPALNKAGRGNEFNFLPVPHNQKVHPTERPVELTTEIYNTFAFPGSRILIPFLGSGNGLISAHQLGMSATGFELSKACKDSFLIKVHGMR